MDEIFYIYKKDGSRIRIGGTDTEPIYLSAKQVQYDGVFLGQSHISFTIKSPIPIPFEGQEYLTIDDEKYTLKYVPSFKKKARTKEYSEAFVYDNIIMQSQIDDTARVDFLDFVLEDNEIHYSAMPTVYFYGTVKDLAMRIQANLDRVYTGDNKWTVKLPDDTSTLPTVEKQITYQDKKVWDAITDIWNQYKVIFFPKGRTLYVGCSQSVIEHNFKYGIGKGLKSLERKTDESNAIITRLHAYGSKINIPYRYYNTIGTTVKPNLPVTNVNGDGLARTLWFKIKDAPMDMFKESNDFTFTGTGPTNDNTDTRVTKTVTFRATKKVQSVSEGTVLFVDCTSQGWVYADYRWLYWAMQESNASVTITSSVVISYVPEIYRSVNSCVNESMYLPNLMLPLIRTNSDAIKYYDDSFNEITDSTKAYYRMVRTGNNSKGLDIYIDSIKGIKQYGIMEGNITFDNNTDNNTIDLVDDENGISPTLTKLTNDDGTSSCKIISATALTDDGILNANGTVDTKTFEVVVKLGFNPVDFLISGETAQISLKTGMCQGRTFDFNCSSNGDGTYTLTCNRIIDGDFAYPNSVYQIKADDTFVFLGIQLPDVYIQSAEQRLLVAGLKYLSKFDHTKNTYSPELDNIFLNSNKDAANEFRIGSLFQFEDDDLNISSLVIPISQITMKIGYSDIREYSITLADSPDIKSDAVQRTISAVQSYLNSYSGNGDYSQIGAIAYSYLKDKFLSKTNNDKANGLIGFEKGLETGTFQSGLLGSGAIIDAKGNAEFESIMSRTFMAAKAFLYNLIEVNIGERWSTNGFCKIKSVDTVNQIITEQLDSDEYSTMQLGDICRGIYSNIGNQYTTENKDADDCGFPTKYGFFTSYFSVTKIIESGKGISKFEYQLRTSTTPHPCALMQAAQYGSFTDGKRRASIFQSNYPHSYTENLEGVNTWVINSANITKRDGWLGDVGITLKNGTKQQLYGYGLYVQDNVYFGSAVIQLSPQTLADLQKELSNYIVSLTDYASSFTADAKGNIIGGLWFEDDLGNKQYRIHTAVSVTNNNNIMLWLADSTKDATENKYKLYVQGIGCSAFISNSTVYITSIDNFNDGIATTDDGSKHTDEWYDIMRKTNSCSVNIIVDCEGKGSIVKTMNIGIKHTEEVFAIADLDNEMSNIRFSLKDSAYKGFDSSATGVTIKHNNVPMKIKNIVFGTLPSGITAAYTLSTDSLSAVITFASSLTTDTLTDFNVPITVVGTLAGVDYESTLYKKFTKIEGTATYELSPSTGSIGATYDADGNKVLSTDKISCGIKCYDDAGENYDLTSAQQSERSLVLNYTTYNQSGMVMNTSSVSVGNSISLSSDVYKIIFSLSQNNTTIDEETVFVNSDGTDGTDGDNGEYYQKLYQLNVSKPTIPVVDNVTNLPTSTQTQPAWQVPLLVKDNDMDISYTDIVGNWTNDYVAYIKSPVTANSEYSCMRINIVTTKDNATLAMEINVSSEQQFDYGVVSNLDDSVSTSPSALSSNSYKAKISGTVNGQMLYFPISKAGTHYIYVYYYKDSSASSGNDAFWFRCTIPNLYSSSAKATKATTADVYSFGTWSDAIEENSAPSLPVQAKIDKASFKPTAYNLITGAATSDISDTNNIYLYAGSHKCTIDSITSDISANIALSVVDVNTAKIVYSASTGAIISTQTYNITVTGKYNGITYTAKTVYSVLVTLNGDTGSRGFIVYPAGEWSSTTTYTNDGDNAPMVLYSGVYYILNVVTSVKGTNPASDTTNWKAMSMIDYIFTKVLFANFAKLGSAVFSGDYMFSQYGTYNGTAYTDGSHISQFSGNFMTNTATSTEFIPYYCVNLKTGKTYQSNAYIKGKVEATSGNIGGLEITSSVPTVEVNKASVQGFITPTFIGLYNVANPQTYYNDYCIVNITTNPDRINLVTNSSAGMGLINIETSGCPKNMPLCQATISQVSDGSDAMAGIGFATNGGMVASWFRSLGGAYILGVLAYGYFVGGTSTSSCYLYLNDTPSGSPYCVISGSFTKTRTAEATYTITHPSLSGYFHRVIVQSTKGLQKAVLWNETDTQFTVRLSDDSDSADSEGNFKFIIIGYKIFS